MPGGGKQKLSAKSKFACTPGDGLLKARAPVNAARTREASQRDEKRMMIELGWIAGSKEFEGY